MAPCHSSSGICKTIIWREQENGSSSRWGDDDRAMEMKMERRKEVSVDNCIVKMMTFERVHVVRKPAGERHHMDSACTFSVMLICSSEGLMWVVTRRHRVKNRKKIKDKGIKI